MTSNHQSPSQEGRAPRTLHEAFGQAATLAPEPARSWVDEVFVVLGAIGVIVWATILALFVAAALLLVGTREANAAEMVGYIDNPVGGRIELYDYAIPKKNVRDAACVGALLAKAWGQNMDDVYGCWNVVQDTVIVRWFSQSGYTDRTYLIKSFTPVRPVGGRK